MRKLKIAQIAPIIERVPPKKYGGTERVVSTLTEELVKRGHDVTLFASGDSLTKAKLESIFPISIREANLKRQEALEWSMLHIGRAYDMQDKFDIIHDHNSALGMPLANISTTPTVVTLHGAVRESTIRMLKQYRNPNFVSISKDQVKFADIAKHTVIPNGLELNDYEYSGTNKGYLLYVGRISEIKGTHIAINVAQRLDLPLIIAAKLDEADKPYFNKYIKSKLNNSKIKWIGEVDNLTRNKLMSEAICLVNPITWREPFGLTMIEAMACGCPVVAFNKGAVPEVMLDGKTGFIVENIEEMVDAIKKIESIKRIDCRNFALKTFNEKVMVDKYEELYENIATENTFQDYSSLLVSPSFQEMFRPRIWEFQDFEFNFETESNLIASKEKN